MHLQINKKIFFYFFLFIIFGTLNNKNYHKYELPKIDSIKIYGLETNNNNLTKSLEFLKLNNIFFINKFKLKEVFWSNNLIEEYKIFKRYPSTLEIKITVTKFLAKTNKDGKTFFIGSNGKLSINKNKNLIMTPAQKYIYAAHPQQLLFYHLSQLVCT